MVQKLTDDLQTQKTTP